MKTAGDVPAALDSVVNDETVTSASAQRSWLARLGANENLNFLLTNRIPRIALTRLVGRLSKVRSRTFARFGIWLWTRFTALDLREARKTEFESLHDCFTRELKAGSRPFDARPEVFSSPSDGIVGACGRVVDGQLYQAKGFPYSIGELFGPTQDPSPFENGWYVTLRLTSAMYHRFHAPHDAVLEHVTYLSGDTWNVNPIALQRIERLFCRNERAVLRGHLAEGGQQPFALVPVAAILVASIRLHFLDVLLHLKRRGPNEMPCRARAAKGEELGWFEHGSTIIVFAPAGFALAEGIAEGVRVKAGEALMRVPQHALVEG